MTARRTDPRPIGPLETPDLGADRLESITVDRLDSRFVLEDARVQGASLAGTDAGSGQLRRVQLQDVDLGESKLRAVECVDVIAEGIDAANGNWGGARLRRVVFRDARLTGLDLAEAHVKQVSFEGCKLDYANFRHSTIEQVSFEDCVLTAADFQGATVQGTAFSGCDLSGSDFTKATLALVDLRSSRLALAGSLLGLRGAIVDRLQLMELAEPLAHELGITVRDEISDR